MTETQIRSYAVLARSTHTHGRVLCSARNHHFVADGPVQNGCPGEAVTPAELFLAGVAACGVELMQVIARERQVALAGVRVALEGVMDRSRPVRPEVTVFNSVHLRFELEGVGAEEGAELVERFKAR
jgi:uncharacterized OsmC-like protein